MPLDVDVSILKSLVFSHAWHSGPDTYSFVRVIDENIKLDYDWYLLAKLFSLIKDPYLLESLCERALKLEIKDMETFDEMVSMMNVWDYL